MQSKVNSYKHNCGRSFDYIMPMTENVVAPNYNLLRNYNKNSLRQYSLLIVIKADPGPPLSTIAGSNPAGSLHVCLLRVLCVVR